MAIQARIAGVVAGYISGGQARIAGIRATTSTGPQARIAGITATTVSTGSGGRARIAGVRGSTGSRRARIAYVDAATLSGTFTLPRITAAAGADVAAKPFQSVALDASASANLDGSIAYTWTQVGGPAVTLSSTSAVAPTFTAPATLAGATLTFQLAVSDGTGAVRTDTVAVTVARHNFFLAGPSGPIPLKITQL